MPYSATIISVTLAGGSKDITIDYSNGVSPTVRDTVRSALPSVPWLQGVVRDRLAQLDQMAAFAPPTGPFAPPPADPLTPFEQDKNTWRQNFNRLRVALVVFDPTDVRITTLKTTLQSTYQNGFLD